MKHKRLVATVRATTLCLVLAAVSGPATAQTQLQLAQTYIQHVIVIMQENRSFDHYFGTFPGADGAFTDGGAERRATRRSSQGVVTSGKASAGA